MMISEKLSGKKVFAAMSGGVDSSVAAALLKESGFDVVGAHMICWRKTEKEGGCESEKEAEDARRVAEKLDIPFYVFDFEKEYRKKVFEYMVKEYAAGRTPNPDVMCNREIKFGLFLEKALSLGADYIATGHYVRLRRNFKCQISNFKNSETDSKFKIKDLLKIKNLKLKIARDSAKDQSYFLWTLTQKQLKHCLFPAGDYLKTEVRDFARKFGLPTAEKKDSQGLCFVGKVDFRDFLKEIIPMKKGKVLAADGKVVGEHDGAMFYTIGQRRGIGVAGAKNPYFVAEKDTASNTLVAVEENDSALHKKEVLVSEVNWILGIEPELPFKCRARIRYRQPLQDCAIYGYDNKKGTVKVLFKKPQRAVASGQSIVFYVKDNMLGGGVMV